jgi:membrane-associated phospholipid phosphatase
MRHWLGLGTALIIALTAAPALAATGQVHELRHDTRVDVAVTVTGGAWLLMSELLKPSLVPEKCRWCYRADDGGDLLNPYDGWVRRRLLWRQTGAAHLASNLLVGVLEPATQLGLDAVAAHQQGALQAFPVDTLLVAEATIVASIINQVTKFAFARERPFVHYLPRAPNALRELTSSPSDNNLSFFSGHTTVAFALATSSAMVATLRGYRLAPLLWGSGLTMAASVGYLRIAADKHYLSDVATGAVVGSIVGIGLPLLFHSRNSEMLGASSQQALTLPSLRPTFSFSGRF